MRRAFALLVLLAAVSAQANVLPRGTYPFKTYGAESGLGNLSTIRVTQDATGFLWVGTQDGLYRYDGTRFRRYGLENGLPSTFIGPIVHGRRDELWVGTGAGLVRRQGERFRRVKSPAAGAVNGLALDARGRLWIAAPEGLFVGGRDSFVAAGGWTGDATAIFFDQANGDIWTASTGVVARQTHGGWTRWEIEPKERIDSVVVDARNRVWFRSGAHLWSMERDGSDLRDETSHLPATSNNGYLSLDARRDLWVPTDRGLAIRDAAGWRIIDAAHGLPTEWARDVFEDREGTIWIASLGLHRMLGRGELVSYKRSNGLPSEVTWCFRWDRQGRLLVGTDLGLARSRPDGWDVVRGTEGMQIRTVIEESDGTLWVAGSPARIIRIDGASGTIRTFEERDGVRGRAIMNMIRDRSGNIWAATRGGGVLRLRAGHDRFEPLVVPAGTPDEDFRDIREDRRGTIWATGQRGLARFEKESWRRFNSRDGLRHDHLAYLMESSSGDYWVVYFEPLGIARIRVSGNSLKVLDTLDTSNGLAANKIFLLGEDKRGRLWVGGGSGVDIVGRGEIEHLSSADGLAGDDTDALAFLCDDDGNVFIGTSSGFSVYVPRTDAPRRQAPTVAITSAALGSRPITVDGKHEFPASVPRRDLSISFSALSYFKPDILEYEVRLVGFDDAWQRVNEPRAQWPRLPPGKYRFEARSRLRPGAWSEAAVVSFNILPAWWQTRTAQVAAGVLLVFFAWLIYRGRVASIRRHNLELQALVDQRTRELAAANDSLLELSVTDALTGIRNRRYLQFCMPQYTAEALRKHETLSRSGSDPTRANGDLMVLLIDLDHFKEVNDRYGHRIGDEILVQLCALLSTLQRESDTIIRWGGEEFLYLAREASRTEAATLAERIRAAVAEHVFRVSTGPELRLTCSIGFAPYPFLPANPRLISWEEVVDVTDLCLYTAKNAGRNCWVGVNPHNVKNPDTIIARVRESLVSVVASGEIELITSPGESLDAAM